jgi:hypothetical protein
MTTFVSRQSDLMQRLVDAQKAENEALAMEIEEMRRLVDDRTTGREKTEDRFFRVLYLHPDCCVASHRVANDPTALDQAYQKVLSEGMVLQLQLDDTYVRRTSLDWDWDLLSISVTVFGFAVSAGFGFGIGFFFIGFGFGFWNWNWFFFFFTCFGFRIWYSIFVLVSVLIFFSPPPILTIQDG